SNVSCASSLETWSPCAMRLRSAVVGSSSGAISRFVGSLPDSAAISLADLRTRCGFMPARIASYQMLRGTLNAIGAKWTYQRADHAAPFAIACFRDSATCTKVKTPFSGLAVWPAGFLQD